MKRITKWFEGRTTLEWVGIICSTTIALVGIVLIFNKYTLFGYTFNVVIWGSVSDWFTYLASAIGIAFILKTFESQMKVQKDQNRIFKIEEKKYIREIKPNITLTHTINKKRWSHPLDNSINNKLLGFQQTLHIIIDKDCAISYKFFSPTSLYHEEKNKFISLGINNDIIISLNIPTFQYIDGIPKFENLFIEILYIDRDGNEYRLLNEYSITYRYNSIMWEVVNKSDVMIKSIY